MTTSIPAFNLGQGTQPSFLLSTPVINPPANQPLGVGQYSSTPFSSSLTQPAHTLNLSALGGPVTTQQTLNSGLTLGTPASRSQGLTGLTGTLGLGSSGPLPQSAGLGILGTQKQPTGLLGTSTQPQTILGSTSGQQGSILGSLLAQPQVPPLATTGQLHTLPNVTVSALGVPTGLTTGLNLATTSQLGRSTIQPQVVTSQSLGTVQTSSSATAPPLTLGGSLPRTGANTATQQTRPNDVKDMQLDPLVDQLVIDLTAFIKQQKLIQTEISKMENRSLQSCEKEYKSMSRSLVEWKRGVSEYSSQVASLKEESLQDIRVAEIAQRTRDLPASLQGDHSDPKLYFHMLCNQFSEKLAHYQQVVQDLGKNFSQMETRPKTPQEVSEIFKLLNDNFISLASNIYSLHSRVADLKDNVLSYSSIYSKDQQICFPKRMPSVPSSTSSGQLRSGPTPFSLSEASLLSHKYSLGNHGSDSHVLHSSHTYNTAPQKPSLGLSLGLTQPTPLSSTLQNPTNKFSSFLTSTHSPQTAPVQSLQTPSFNLSLKPPSSQVYPSSQFPAAPGVSPHRRGSISGESEESKRAK